MKTIKLSLLSALLVAAPVDTDTDGIDPHQPRDDWIPKMPE
jgi:hypothetical protein